MGRGKKIPNDDEYLFRPPYSRVLEILAHENRPMTRKELLNWKYPGNYPDRNLRWKPIFKFTNSRMSQILSILWDRGLVFRDDSTYRINSNYLFLIRSNLIIDMMMDRIYGECDWEKGIAIFNTPFIDEINDIDLKRKKERIVRKSLKLFNESGVIEEIEKLNIKANLKLIEQELWNIQEKDWDDYKKLYTWLYVQEKIELQYETIALTKHIESLTPEDFIKEGIIKPKILNRLKNKEKRRYKAELDPIFKLPKSLNDIKNKLVRELKKHKSTCDTDDMWNLLNLLESKKSIDKTFRQWLFFESLFAQYLLTFEKPHPLIVLGNFDWEYHTRPMVRRDRPER